MATGPAGQRCPRSGGSRGAEEDRVPACQDRVSRSPRSARNISWDRTLAHHEDRLTELPNWPAINRRFFQFRGIVADRAAMIIFVSDAGSHFDRGCAAAVALLPESRVADE